MTIITQKTAFYVGHIEQLPRHFCFESQGCFVFGNDALRHANKGAQQMAEHRLCDTSRDDFSRLWVELQPFSEQLGF